MNTPGDAAARMHSRALTLRIALVVLLIIGVIGSALVGLQAGKSLNFDTGLLLTSTSTDNTARGVTFFFA